MTPSNRQIFGSHRSFGVGYGFARWYVPPALVSQAADMHHSIDDIVDGDEVQRRRGIFPSTRTGRCTCPFDAAFRRSRSAPVNSPRMKA